ncbi:MAG: hypothetical protein U5N53_28220 [Mycobacterium sp.]|nr:hypothetical protein [Mycobacterium sp.]
MIFPEMTVEVIAALVTSRQAIVVAARRHLRRQRRHLGRARDAR